MKIDAFRRVVEMLSCWPRRDKTKMRRGGWRVTRFSHQFSVSGSLNPDPLKVR